ncbi:MAG: uroporphyrinogen decarboxylase [Hyphomicrobiales bacterium]|nr:uroporphyrinogen decarboxylase [Hyphomicrobiales bacterium]
MLRVLDGEALKVPPIWLMRQAGRYLPEYRQIRAEAKDFLDLCYTPKLACEVTLQPIRRFGLDAAILFSDILVVPHAMGQSVAFEEGRGPILEPIRDGRGIAALDEGNAVEHLAPVIETVGRVESELPESVALIGFCGAPWTVATYMIAGHGTSDQAPARLFAYRNPGDMTALIDKLVAVSIDYLVAQLEAGADAVQIFDTWSGVLNEDQFEKWVIGPTKRIVSGVRSRIKDARIVGFPKGAGPQAERFVVETKVNGIGIDWATPRKWAKNSLQNRVAVQGNIDPMLMITGGEALDRDVDDLLAMLGDGRLIVNLGHGITPEAKVENVERLIARVRDRAA